jgi:hypothetical protein
LGLAILYAFLELGQALFHIGILGLE